MVSHQENHPMNNPTQDYQFQPPYDYPYHHQTFHPQYNTNIDQNNIFPEIKKEDLEEIEKQQEIFKGDNQTPKNVFHSQPVPNHNFFQQRSNFNYNRSFGYSAQNYFYAFPNHFNSFQNKFPIFPPYWHNTSSNTSHFGQQTKIEDKPGELIDQKQIDEFPQVKLVSDPLSNIEDNIEVKEEEQSFILETSDLGSSMNKTCDLSDNSLDGSKEDSKLMSNESPTKLSIFSNKTLNECVDPLNLPKEEGSNNELKPDLQDLSKKVSNEEIQTKTTEEYSKQEFNNVRYYSEWIIDDTLPEGWKKRYCKRYSDKDNKAKRYQYLSQNQQIFSSRSEIVAYMRNSTIYSENDILKVLSGKQNNPHVNKSEWHEDNYALPSGWKTRYVNRNRFFISRENKKIKTVTSAIKFMIDSKNYSKEEIDKVKERYTNRGLYTSNSDKVIENNSDKVIEKVREIGQVVPWETDELLPQGWQRKFANGHHQFLSPENKRFQSVSAAINFMRISGKYSEQEVGQILQVGRIQSLKRTTNNQQGLQRIGNPSGTLLANWETHDSLPKGWKKRYAHHHHQFLSPENKRFQSLNSALMFMKNANYSQEDIVKLVKVCREQSKNLTTNRDVGKLGDMFYNG